MEFELPIYYKKKGKDVLTGLNDYRNLHYRAKNSLKKKYTKLVELALADKKYQLYEGVYAMTYTLYYKNPICDLGNVNSVIDKFTLDALQEHGVVKRDSVKYCVDIHHKVGGQDKENPRIVIKLTKKRTKKAK